MPQPTIASGPPLPPIVTMPSIKSVGASGIGSGLQRIWFGDGATSSKRLTIRDCSILTKDSCTAAGRIRYSHERRLCARGAVKAVPESCSAYRPYGARCGEFCPTGSAPGSASVANSLAKPDW